MSHPAQGNKVTMKDYLKGDTRTHLIGMLGGFIWMSGMVVSFMGAGSANPAIAYALSNAAPVVAMIWGFFVWKEFKGAPKGTVPMIATMFVLFVVGLVLNYSFKLIILNFIVNPKIILNENDCNTN